MHKFVFLLLILLSTNSSAQILPSERSVDWTLAGLRDTSTLGFQIVDLQAQGLIGDGVFSNDEKMNQVLDNVEDQGSILIFPAGNFLFNNTIELPSNIILKGQGADQTILTMDLGGTGHSIDVRGTDNNQTAAFLDSATVSDNFIRIENAALFSVGDWVHILQDDVDLVTSTWAENTVGQILRIKAIDNQKITFDSPLRLSYGLERTPFIKKITPKENVGIECLKIHRLDSSAPEQSSNISFSHTANSWVKGVESENCTFSHFQARNSSNISVSKSYFHHAFEYGGGGRAYGVMLHSTTNECLIENNVFEHLRHSMIVQSGANGNVFAYNYSFDPFWESVNFPSDSAGDMVLHGNYSYSNLFEGNVCANMVIDNSHGPNGPFNTFFRNRGEKFGIFFSAANSPKQNLIGNEITNSNQPYINFNYLIQGVDHFIHGNNNKGVIHPAGTDTLLDLSYFLSEKPDYFKDFQWAGIGPLNEINEASLPALVRVEAGEIFSNSCGNLSVGLDNATPIQKRITLFPNPATSEFSIESELTIESIKVLSPLGEIMEEQKNVGRTIRINSSRWSTGIYVVAINFSDGSSSSELIIIGKE